jgi:hypothetical protein
MRAIQTECVDDVRACGAAAIVLWDMAPPSKLIAYTWVLLHVPCHHRKRARPDEERVCERLLSEPA